MSTISSFKSIKNKYDIFRGKIAWKSFINPQESTKKMKKTKEQQESYQNANISYLCKEKFENKHVKEKKYCQVRDHCHKTGI